MKNNPDIKIIRVPMLPPNLGQSFTPNSNAYLIGNEMESILIDAGYDQPETKTALEKTIIKNGLAKPKSIILTHAHPDHAPGIRQLADWSPIVYCHGDEKEAVQEAISPVNKISILNDGDALTVAGVEIIAIHGPGHTSGHLSVYIPSKKVLIAGDNIVAEGTTWIGGSDGDMLDYVETLNRLKKLDLSKIGPGHGDWIINPYEQIEFVLNRRLHREIQIKSFLTEHEELSSTKLTKLIYENTIPDNVFEYAKMTTEAHLLKLIKENIVTMRDSIYSLK